MRVTCKILYHEGKLTCRKGFATSLSIIVSFLASIAIFSHPINLSFLIGASIVFAAIYVYNSGSIVTLRG